jgi:formylmethanofuran dehydrogenase subunit B
VSDLHSRTAVFPFGSFFPLTGSNISCSRYTGQQVKIVFSDGASSNNPGEAGAGSERLVKQINGLSNVKNEGLKSLHTWAKELIA